MAKSKGNVKKRDFIINAVERAVDATTVMFDARPFTNIEINNNKIRSVLDSGAAVSILGRESRELIEAANIAFMSQHTKYTAVIGDEHIVIGKAFVPVRYQEQEHKILFYLCPSLIQQAYLGMDFFHAFGLAVG